MPIDYEAARQWLKRYYFQTKLIENKIQRLEFLEQKAHSLGVPVLDGMPKAKSWNGDKYGSIIDAYMDLKQELPADLETGRRIYKQIDDQIKRICKNNPDMKLVLQMKYLDLFDWVDIVEALFLGKTDYLEKEDSYTRRTFKLHKNGITCLSEIMGEKELQEIADFYGDNFDFQ